MAATVNFSGIASGIDSSSLIQALLDQQRASRITPLEKKNTELTDSNSALAELKSKLSTLQTTLRGFSSLTGGAVSKIASSSDETKVTATASKAAANGSYSVNVTQLAKNETYSFRSTAGAYTSSTSAIASGINNADPAIDRTVSFSIGSSSPESVSVEITSSTTLESFVADFNSQSDRATASIANVGTSASPDYRILISSNTTGTAEGSITTTVGASITGQSAFNNNSEDNATDAEFTLSRVGGTITRSSNTVSDLITGLSFQLNATGSATLSVGTDAETTKAGVSDFVDQFNEIVSFIQENNLVSVEGTEDGGSEALFAALSGTSVDDSVLSSLRSALSGTSYSGGSAVSIFANLGISTERDGTLAFDEDAFDEAIADEPESVNQILLSFADTVSLTGGTIDSYIRYNGLIDITKNSNQTLIDDNQERIDQYESQLEHYREQLTLRFAKLESVIGGLQQQQQSLSSALAGLGS